MTSRNWRRLNVAMPWLVIIGLLVIWQAVVDIFAIAAFILPSPTAVFAAFLEYRDAILHNAMFTLKNTMFGFALGIVVGVVLGVLIGSFRLVYSGLYPLLIGVNSVPKAAVVPILVLWLGIGTAPAIATAFLLCFFPIAVNVATGLATVEPELEDVLRSLGASKLDILRKVGLPRSMPYFFASLKVAITLAFVGTVISETLASNDGIGYLMLQASSQFRVPLMFAGLGNSDLRRVRLAGSEADGLGHAASGRAPRQRRVNSQRRAGKAKRAHASLRIPETSSAWAWRGAPHLLQGARAGRAPLPTLLFVRTARRLVRSIEFGLHHVAVDLAGAVQR
jgi:NitT/TauT family transport system permease protein